MNILGICLPAILPNRGKQRAPVEKAACPCWASTVPIFGIKAITVFLYDLECSVAVMAIMQTFALFFHTFSTFRIIYIFQKFLNLQSLMSQ